MNESEVSDAALSCGSLTGLVAATRYRGDANPAVAPTAGQVLQRAPARPGEGPDSAPLQESNDRRSDAGSCASDRDDEAPDSSGDAPDSDAEPRDADFEHRSLTGSDATGRGFRTPGGWASRDDVLGSVPDRQVLVVGDGIVGRTLTALLQRTGYEPVLAAGTERPVESTLVQLGPRAVACLEQVGLGGRVRDRSTRVESVVVSRPADSGSRKGSLSSSRRTGRSESVVVEAAEVRRTLAVECPIQRARTDRPIADVTTAPDGIVVEFVDGVQEWFDVVVDTVGTPALQRTDADVSPEHTLNQYERQFDLEGAASNELHDVWLPDGLVQSVPCAASSETLVRVTTARNDASRLLSQDGLEGRCGLDANVVSSILSNVQPTPVQQSRLGDDQLPQVRWGRDRVAGCGSGACPVAPATGCAVSFGLQDAVAFVAELARCERSIEAAIDAYATTRKRTFTRAQVKRKTAELDGIQSSTGLRGSALRTLDAFRTVALDSVLESTGESR